MVEITLEMAEKRGLIEEATRILFGGKYSPKWIEVDSKWVGLCGGRDGYRWEMTEEGTLRLWHCHFGVPRGLDGANTPWRILHVISIREENGSRVFELVS